MRMRNLQGIIEANFEAEVEDDLEALFRRGDVSLFDCIWSLYCIIFCIFGRIVRVENHYMMQLGVAAIPTRNRTCGSDQSERRSQPSRNWKNDGGLQGSSAANWSFGCCSTDRRWETHTKFIKAWHSSIKHLLTYGWTRCKPLWS